MKSENSFELSLLYIIGTLEFGGAESQITMLISECKKRGFNCQLFVLETKGPFLAVLQQHGVIIHNGGYDSSANTYIKLLLLLRALIRLCFIIHNTKPNILHSYLPLTNFLGSLAARITGLKQIVTSRRALGTHQDRHKYWKLFDRLINFFSLKVTVNSQAVWQDTLNRDSINPEKLVLIPNGLDVKRFEKCSSNRTAMRKNLDLDNDEIGIVMVANLIPYKGHEDVLQALSIIVSKKITNFKIYFVGENRGIQNHLEKVVQNLMLFPHVIFLGMRNDVPNILSAMDIYVIASHEEGFSNALLEAMAAGLAIIATDVGGNKEALEDGQLGILVPSRNPAAIANALVDLIKDKNRREQLGNLAMTNVRSKYSINKMVEAHINLYQNLTQHN